MKGNSQNTDSYQQIIADVLMEFTQYDHAQNMRDYRNHVGPYIEGLSETKMIASLPSTEELVIRKHEFQALMQAMEKLPKLQRKRIYAYFFLELSMTRIAAIENVSVASVSRSIQRGINNLRWLIS